MLVPRFKNSNLDKKIEQFFSLGFIITIALFCQTLQFNKSYKFMNSYFSNMFRRKLDLKLNIYIIINLLLILRFHHMWQLSHHRPWEKCHSCREANTLIPPNIQFFLFSIIYIGFIFTDICLLCMKISGTRLYIVWYYDWCVSKQTI